MCSTSDGFRIADEDLRLRGPGDFFGEKQHGLPDLKIANMAEDMEILKEAQSAARNVLSCDPKLEHRASRLKRTSKTPFFRIWRSRIPLI